MSKKELFDFRNRELELEVVSSITDNPHYIKDVNNLVLSNDFYFDDTRVVYEEIISMWLKSDTITRGMVTLALIRNGKSSITKQSDFAFVESSSGFSVVMENVMKLKELSMSRNIWKFVSNISDKLKENDPFNCIKAIGNFYEESLNFTSNKKVSTNKEAIASTLPLIEEKMKSKKDSGFSGIPTGLSEVDRKYGGWQNDELIIIAGRPGMAKTITMIELGKNASKSGFKVLLVCLEMSKESLIFRLLSGQLEDISYSDIKSGRINQEDYSRINSQTVTELENLPLYWYDDEDRDISTLSLEIEKQVKTQGIQIVMIDYLQLIEDKSLGNYSNDDFKLTTQVSKKLKKLQKRLKIPLIALSQLSRGPENRKGDERKPQIQDLRSSGQIEQEASVIIGLYREDYYERQTNPHHVNTNEFDLVFLKVRDGGTGEIKVFCDVKTNRIRDSLQLLNFESKREIPFEAENYNANKVFKQINNINF